MKNHLMIDIETLDTKPSAVILSIAAVEFDPWGKNDKMFHYYVDIDDQIKQGRTVSAGTVLWWLNQEEGARKAQYEARNRLMLYDAIASLYRFSQGLIVWANSPMFDINILNHANDQLVPGRSLFHFSDQRDVRTLSAYIDYDEVKWTRPAGTYRHDALADCLDQIDIVRHFYKKFNIQPDEPEESEPGGPF